MMTVRLEDLRNGNAVGKPFDVHVEQLKTRSDRILAAKSRFERERAAPSGKTRIDAVRVTSPDGEVVLYDQNGALVLT